MSDYNYSTKGSFVQIKRGADLELHRRNWHRGVENNYDGQTGVVDFEFGAGTGDHHFGVKMLDGECVGFPPDYIIFNTAQPPAGDGTGRRE